MAFCERVRSVKICRNTKADALEEFNFIKEHYYVLNNGTCKKDAQGKWCIWLDVLVRNGKWVERV